MHARVNIMESRTALDVRVNPDVAIVEDAVKPGGRG
ncbi:hypothetical protein ES703_36053 [subsurface metagenome]